MSQTQAQPSNFTNVQPFPVCMKNVQLADGILAVKTLVALPGSWPVRKRLHDRDVIQDPLAFRRMGLQGLDQHPLMGVVPANLVPLHFGALRSAPSMPYEAGPGRFLPPTFCSTPVLNSGMCGFIVVQASERPITCRVAAGSMRASTHRRAAA